jgi:hypothetical protein
LSDNEIGFVMETIPIGQHHNCHDRLTRPQKAKEKPFVSYADNEHEHQSKQNRRAINNLWPSSVVSEWRQWARICQTQTNVSTDGLSDAITRHGINQSVVCIGCIHGRHFLQTACKILISWMTMIRNKAHYQIYFKNSKCNNQSGDQGNSNWSTFAQDNNQISDICTT